MFSVRALLGEEGEREQGGRRKTSICERHRWKSYLNERD